MKKLFLLLFISATMFAQTFTTAWVSSSITSDQSSGWFSFNKEGSIWKNRLYLLDTIKFQVMSAGYSTTPQYTYTFSADEILAGEQIYALGYDLTGDNITEFYILGYYGTATSYRQGFKIFDITDGRVLLAKADAANSYTYPTVSDINSDGLLEVTYAKYPYPLLDSYVYEILNTGITGTNQDKKPYSFTVQQNYPNPFNPSTTISYILEKEGRVQLDIYDLQGSLIRNLENKEAQAGEHSVVWDGKDNSGMQSPTGIYFYRLSSGPLQAAKKMILLK